MPMPRSLPRAALAVAAVLALSACGMHGAKKAEPPPSGETFGATDTYSRSYEVAPAVACEAARRALLGQGYVIGKADGSALEASKSFQPDAETHTQLNVRATCVPQADNGSLVFVNAVQDRYALKTTSNTASVGVSVLGSVSVPIGSSGANLVRVASNTVQNEDFYKRFFDRVKYYLPGTEGVMKTPPPPEPAAPPDPVPPAPATPASAPAATPATSQPAPAQDAPVTP